MRLNLQNYIFNVPAGCFAEFLDTVFNEFFSQLFLGVHPDIRVGSLGFLDFKLGIFDEDFGVHRVVVEVQGGNDLDPVEFECDVSVVVSAFGSGNGQVKFPGKVQQSELKFGCVHAVGVIHLNQRDLGQVVFDIVEMDIFHYELVTILELTAKGSGVVGDFPALIL